jgi:hypothetical protein
LLISQPNKALQAILQTRPFFAVTAKNAKIGQARKTPELGVMHLDQRLCETE